MITVKYFINKALLVVSLIVTSVFLSCYSNKEEKVTNEEDAKAKSMLQGTWVNEYEGNVVFSVKGDTIFYNDSLSTPARVFVSNDTLFIENHDVVKYPIHRLNSSSLVFVNADGDEVELTKSGDATLARGEYKGAVALNQKKKIKTDTVMVYKDKHYHAYTQVNPTTYKVYRQTTNNDGLRVESIYYDNIVYIALYNGQQKVFGQNVSKSEFAQYVPKTYLEQAVLSDIYVDGVGEKGVTFVAVLAIPDSYTNYRINIVVGPDGQKTLFL